MTAILWSAFALQLVGAAAGLLLGSPLGAGVAIVCLGLAALLAAAALSQ